MQYKKRPSSDDQLFEMIIKEDDKKTGVFAVGLVETPAIEIDQLVFSKDTDNLNLLKLKDDNGKYKKIVTGPIMIPEQFIYRSSLNGEYQVKASAETIKNAQEKFFKSGYNDRTTHQHQIPLFSNTVIESQIIENSTIDKAKHLGFDLPVGTQMLTVKIDDNEYQEKEVLSGNVKGFSLEGLFEHVEIPNNFNDEPVEATEENHSKVIIKEKKKKRKSLKSMINSLIRKMLKLEAETPENKAEMEAATIILEFMVGEMMVEVDQMMIMTYAESGELVPAGTYDATSIDGTMVWSIEVLEEGKVAMFKTSYGMEAPADTTEQTEENQTEEAPAETEMEKMSKEIVAMSSMIKSLNDELTKMKNPVNKKIEVKPQVDKFTTEEKEEDAFKSVLNKFIKK